MIAVKHLADARRTFQLISSSSLYSSSDSLNKAHACHIVNHPSLTAFNNGQIQQTHLLELCSICTAALLDIQNITIKNLPV